MFYTKMRSSAKFKLISISFLNYRIISYVDHNTVVQGRVRKTFIDKTSSLMHKRRVKSSRYVRRITPHFVKAGEQGKRQVFPVLRGFLPVPCLPANRGASNARASRRVDL